jgi:hypothetical protein
MISASFASFYPQIDHILHQLLSVYHPSILYRFDIPEFIRFRISSHHERGGSEIKKFQVFLSNTSKSSLYNFIVTRSIHNRQEPFALFTFSGGKGESFQNLLECAQMLSKHQNAATMLPENEEYKG